ncbi:MAG: class F sortase [Candidatus Saccharimonadales bacterium]
MAQPAAPLETTNHSKPDHNKSLSTQGYHHKHHRKSFRFKSVTKTQMALYSAAAILFIGGLGVSLDGWRANTAVHAQVKQLTRAVATIPRSEGGTAPDTSDGNTQAVKASGGGRAYTVAPEMPKYLRIPSLGVNARVITVGIIKDGSLGTPPPNTNQVGWYGSSSKPGDAGAMVIDGHVSGLKTVGVFYNIKKLKPGDGVQVERGDGQIISYRVVKVVTYDADKVDMDALSNPVDYSKPGLNLITCAGQYNTRSGEFNERTVVFTEQI